MELRRVSVFSICCIILIFTFGLSSGEYRVPDVRIEVFQPKGFRASIPDEPGINVFVFQGNVNEDLAENGVGDLSGEIKKATDGRWVYEDSGIKLKIGDVINYYVFLSVNGVGYVKDNLHYTVTEFASRSVGSSEQSPNCKPSSTILKKRTACSGQVVFEDNFDTLDDYVWEIEHKIPFIHAEHPFVSYQNLLHDPTVFVQNGQLHIRPKLQESLPGFNSDSLWQGTLDLMNRCTSTVTEECSMTAYGSSILPPVVSGRIKSFGFVFQYGIIEIKAKLPTGDWVYPEILLEPFISKYGNLNFASGVIKIACSRGNAELSDIGNKLLYGGPVMESICHNSLLMNNTLRQGRWSDDFHKYTVRWEPDRLTFLVDDNEWARVEPNLKLSDNLRRNCNHPIQARTWEHGGKMAPFDQQFSLTLGVAVGGITEFPDDFSSNGRSKPWRNPSSKASLHFWEDKDSWFPTWNDNTALIVDYVKITAL